MTHNASCTPIEQSTLSPFLSETDQFYSFITPIHPMQITYNSPKPNIGSLINECDAYDNSSTYILRKRFELLTSGNESSKCLKDEESTKLITIAKKGIRKLKSNEDRIIRRRERKNAKQINYLITEYERNPNWDKNTIAEIAKEINLTEIQIYKWNWDQRKKKP